MVEFEGDTKSERGSWGLTEVSSVRFLTEEIPCMSPTIKQRLHASTVKVKQLNRLVSHPSGKRTCGKNHFSQNKSEQFKKLNVLTN